MCQIMEDFDKTRQYYQKEMENIKEFLEDATEKLMDITCDLYVLNAEVMTIEDPALYDRVNHLLNMSRQWQSTSSVDSSLDPID